VVWLEDDRRTCLSLLLPQVTVAGACEPLKCNVAVRDREAQVLHPIPQQYSYQTNPSVKFKAPNTAEIVETHNHQHRVYLKNLLPIVADSRASN